jgi:hypothetical protein
MWITANARHRVVILVSGLRRAVAGVVVGCLAAAAAMTGLQQAPLMTPVAEPFDPEVILPIRVDAALHRVLAAVERSVAAMDDKRRAAAKRSLGAASVDFNRSHKAVVHQVQAVPDPDAEEESTAGPDSALAALNVAQVSVGMLAGLFDRVRPKGLVRRVNAALRTAQVRRQALLTIITGMDPEEGGAPYVELLVDTAPQYTDEVAAIQEALDDDKLTPLARIGLQQALARSQSAEAVVLAAVGPPE